MSIYPWLVRNVVYPGLVPLLRRAPGHRIMPLVAQWEAQARWPPERIREQALANLRALIAHAIENVPLYREKYRAAGVEAGDIRTWEDFARLPRLTREDLRDRSADLVARNVPPSRRSLHGTSGSSGTPVKFWIDREREVQHLANVHLNQRWIGVEVGERRMLFWGDVGGPRGPKSWRKRFQSRLLNRVFFPAAELKPEVLALFHRELSRFRPRLLTTFPSRIAVYVQWCRDEGKAIPHVPLVICTGETLHANQRSLIEEAFGAQVFNRYGSIELADVAHECLAHQGMHINAHRVWVETVPAEDLEDGQGLVLLTEQFNRATPFIRYECGDIGRLWPADTTHACPCGLRLPRLQEIVGRVIDIVRSPTGRVFTRIAFTSVARKIPGIVNFQVVHRRPRTLIYRYQPAGTFPADGERQIRDLLNANTDNEFDVSVERVEHLALTRAGKLRAVVFE